MNFVLCDDNSKLLDNLSKMLEIIFIKHSFDAQILFSTSKAEELIDYIEKNNKMDVLILDINLHSDMTGLQIAQLVRKHNKNCYIIFSTAYFEYALVAYKYKTFDYLCKPITRERLEETILRLFEDASGSHTNYIKIDNKNTIINENEVQYIQRDGMKIIFHTSNRDYEIYSSFTKIQDKLPNNFVRCHKSFIANVNNITKLEPNSNMIYFNNDSSCDIGPKYKNILMGVFEKNGNFK